MRPFPEGTLAVINVKKALSGILIGAADRPERSSQRTTLLSSCQEIPAVYRVKKGKTVQLGK